MNIDPKIRLREYENLIGNLAWVYEVLALRSPYSVSTGIYVVGVQSRVVRFIEILHSIISKTELATSKVRKNAYNKGLTIRDAKQEFKDKCIQIYKQSVIQMLETYKPEVSPLVPQYIKQINLLKSLIIIK